jgi:hypothetical protein
MDYRTHLFRPLSKRFVDLLVLEVFAHPGDFEIVYQLIFDTEEKVAWRAAWACQKISEKHSEWFSNKHFKELATLAISTNQGGLKRGCLSILNNLPIPVPIPVDLLNACFEWMISPKSPISVQALSMKLLYRICLIEPDLKPELFAYLDNVNYEDYTPGFKSTRKNILKALNSK